MTKEPFETGRPAHVRNGKKPSEPFKYEQQTDDPSSFKGLLSEQEKDDIRAQAREQVLKEQKDREKNALLQKYLKEERQELDPKEALVPIIVHLAPHANYIMLDGKQFFTDTVYEVTQPVADVLIEQMNRGWAHEEITQVTDSKGRRRFRPPVGVGFGNFMDNRLPRNVSIGPNTADAAIAAQRGMMHG